MKTYLVIGATGGIGGETARLLAKQGHKVAIAGRNVDKLNTVARELGSSCVASVVIGDDMTMIGPLIQLDGIVYAIGAERIMPLGLEKRDGLSMQWEHGPGAFIVLVSGLLGRLNSGASIVAVTSAAAHRGVAGMVAYSAAKAAMDGAVRAMAIELAPRKIRVNAVAPGAVRTAMHDRIMKRLTDMGRVAYEEKHPLGVGHADEVAEPIAFLLSDAARWITGVTLPVDGGLLAKG